MSAHQPSVPAAPTAAPASAARGVWSPVLVPVDADLCVDTERLVAHVRWLLERGCHGLALFGTTSEANSFSVEERIATLEAVLEAGTDPRRLMVGTGCCALTDSVRLTRHAAESGCKQVLMLPPFYYKGVSDAGLHRSFATVLDRVGDAQVRLYFYHFPRLTGVPITVGLVEALLRTHPEQVAGLKDSSGDWDHTRDLIGRFPDLAIFPGSETYLLRGLRAGGAGCITASANVHPAAVRAVYEAWRAEDPEADSLDESMRAVRAAIERHPMVPALKHIAAHYRHDPAWAEVRPPLERLGAEAGAALVASLEALGFAPGLGAGEQGA